MLLVSFGVIGLIFDLRFFILMPALRLYRLMRYLPTLQHLLELAIGSMKPISNLLVFMLVCSLAVAVTGRYVFADKMNSSRSNFGTFPEAMITVFQVSAKITSIIMAQSKALLKYDFGAAFHGRFMVERAVQCHGR